MMATIIQIDEYGNAYFDTTDFDVGFISSEDLILFVGVLIHERLNADGGSFTVVGDLLVGDTDVIQVF